MKPLLENDKVICAHNGIVQLKSDKGSDLIINGNPAITKSDLINASISGYTHNIAGVPKPCIKIMQIPDNETGGEAVVLEDMPSMIMTDNGVPLQLQGNQEKPLILDN